MNTRLRIALVLALFAALLVAPTLAMAQSAPPTPAGFCTTANDATRPGWQLINVPAGILEPCSGNLGNYQFTDEQGVHTYNTWSEAETARAGRNATYYFVPAGNAPQPTAQKPQLTPAAPQPTATAQCPYQTLTREDRLICLDPVYRSQGWQAWLRAAGVTFDSNQVESRQPLERIISGSNGKSKVVVEGLVIRGTKVEVNPPAILTTDHPEMVQKNSSTISVQPDPNNPSVDYTSVVLNGQGTIYVDGRDWANLMPPELQAYLTPGNGQPKPAVPQPTTAPIPPTQPPAVPAATQTPVIIVVTATPAPATATPTQAAATATNTATSSPTATSTRPTESGSTTGSKGGIHIPWGTIIPWLIAALVVAVIVGSIMWWYLNRPTGPLPVVTNTPLPAATVGRLYGNPLAATGGTAPYTWNLVNGAGGAWVTLRPGGILSGTPTAAIPAQFTITAIDNNGRRSAPQVFTLTVNPAPAALNIPQATPLPQGTVGTAYTQAFTASGGVPPYTFALGGGAPGWMSISAAGTLTGTPPAATPVNFSVTVTDNAGGTFTKNFALPVVAPTPSLGISTGNVLPNGTAGVAYTQMLAATGGTPAYGWTTLPGGPAWLTVNATTGQLSGTPPAAAPGAAVNVRVIDSIGRTFDKTFFITVDAGAATLTITNASPLPNATHGAAYTQTLRATGGLTPRSWSFAGVHPAWMSLSTTGRITGTPPAAAAATNFNVQVMDGNGTTATKRFRITVV